MFEWIGGDSLTRKLQDLSSPSWAHDHPPACPLGMDMLRRLEAARPNDYSFLQAQDFADLSTSAFDGIPEWDAFTEHCRACEDCMRSCAACGKR